MLLVLHDPVWLFAVVFMLHDSEARTPWSYYLVLLTHEIGFNRKKIESGRSGVQILADRFYFSAYCRLLK